MKGSRTWIKEILAEVQSTWEQVKVMDKRLLEIGCGYDSEEAMTKEFQDQSEYEERIIQLQKIVNKYLAGGEMEKPSVVGSITRNVINPDELARERVPLVGETVREIS